MNMVTTLNVDVVSAEQEVFSGEATFVALPGESGELGIMPGHTPLITRIKPGAVRITLVDGSQELVFVAGGVLEVQPKGVTVLADTAIRGEDLDEARALEAKARAEAIITENKSDIDYARAQSELAVAVAQIAALSQMSKKH
jgi:F-type H+-transporting ATPase subunit epsilon